MLAGTPCQPYAGVLQADLSRAGAAGPCGYQYDTNLYTTWIFSIWAQVLIRRIPRQTQEEDLNEFAC